MVAGSTIAVIGTLLGAFGGAIIGGWFGLKQTRLQQRAENKRRQADVFLELKAKRLAELTKHISEAAGLLGARGSTWPIDYSDSVTYDTDFLDDMQTSEKELREQFNRSMLYISWDNAEEISDAVDLLTSMFSYLDNIEEEPYEIVWSELPTNPDIRQRPNLEFTHHEAMNILNSGLGALRDEIQGPVRDLQQMDTSADED